MNKLSKIMSAALLVIFTSQFLSAQNTDQTLIQKNLNTIFDKCVAQEYKSAASLFVYNGKDETRKWKTSFDADNKGELNQVKRICKKIKAFLDISDSHSFGKFVTSNESEGAWYVQEVIFKSGGQSLTAMFAFLKIGDHFLLGDID